jgi:hypothetical protein
MNEIKLVNPKLNDKKETFILKSNIHIQGFQLQSKITTRLLPIKLIPIPPAIVDTIKRRERIFVASLNFDI